MLRLPADRRRIVRHASDTLLIIGDFYAEALFHGQYPKELLKWIGPMGPKIEPAIWMKYATDRFPGDQLLQG